MAFGTFEVEQDPHVFSLEEFPFDWLDLPVVFVVDEG
jgi:hypothetical protein